MLYYILGRDRAVSASFSVLCTRRSLRFKPATRDDNYIDTSSLPAVFPLVHNKICRQPIMRSTTLGGLLLCCISSTTTAFVLPKPLSLATTATRQQAQLQQGCKTASVQGMGLAR